MRLFKSDDLLVSVLPAKKVEKKYPSPSGRDCECTPSCTNLLTPDTTTACFSARVSKKDLATLRRLLTALQK